MVTITDTARGKIQELLNQNSGKYLRIFEQPGWWGSRMGMALDEPQESEKPVQINGVGILISEDDMLYVDGTIIDYITQSYNEGFTITGPRESCWFSQFLSLSQRGSFV